jgi:alpha-beta hydrolase superfamily lysophospholipase
MPLAYRVTLWTVAHTARWWTLTGKGIVIRATDNDDILREMGRDPLVIKQTRADALYGLVHLMGEARDAAPRLGGTRVLFMYGGKDQVIPRAATEYVVSKLGPGAKVNFYPGGYHLLLRDHAGPERWADILDWVTETEVASAD